MNTLEAAVHLLRRHNRWRRGDETVCMVDPALLGCAIDVVCDHAERHDELVEALTHLEHNARKSGAEMGLALDVSGAVLAKVGKP